MPTFASSGRNRGGQTVRRPRRAGAAGPKAGTPVPAKNLAVFTRQFSVMIDAGLPLVQCLDILGKQESHKNFSAAILKVREDVEAGAALADAMKKHPRTFDPLYSNMIAAGEAGGILPTILERLAVYIDKTVSLKSSVKAAMMYPAAVMVIATLVVAMILWKVVPTFADLFQGLGAQLPFATRIVIHASDAVIAYGLPTAAGVALGLFATRRYYATEAGRRVIDAWLLKTPTLGAVLRKVAVARFCRTLSTLLASGVPILEGLDITARTAGNAVVEQAIQTARSRIERGETVAAAVRATSVFPPLVGQMINVGEAAGALESMLSRIADFYEEEADTAITALLKLMEPAVIVVLGVVVGGIVIALYLPIFDLVNRVG